MPTQDALRRPDWLAPLTDPLNETILTAAFEAFEEAGFTAARLDDIAARAEVSLDTVRGRFDGKEGLFYALLAWAARQSPWDIGAIDDAAIAADPEGVLRDFVRATLRVETCREGVAVHRILIAEARELPPAFSSAAHDLMAGAGRDLIARLAATLTAQGKARIDDPEEFFACFAGLMRGLIQQDVLMGVRAPPSDEEVRDWADRASHRLLRAFAPE